MTGTFPPSIGVVAIRALERAGVHSPAQLGKWTESDVLALHGIGPKTIATLRPFLAGQDAAISRVDTRSTKGRAQVDAYLAAVESPHRQTLEALRATSERFFRTHTRL